MGERFNGGDSTGDGNSGGNGVDWTADFASQLYAPPKRAERKSTSTATQERLSPMNDVLVAAGTVPALPIVDKTPSGYGRAHAVIGKSTPEAAAGYAEPPAEAANRKKNIERWNPSKGTLNPFDPSAWSKLQDYAGDVGRANGWSKEDDGTFPQINALRHALASAYITYNDSATMALTGGLWHEIQTGAKEVSQGVPWSTKPDDIHTWQDHNIDTNNNLAGAKIAQEIRQKGGSWQDVENAIVDAVKHLGPNGRIPQPSVTLHSSIY